MDRRTPQDDDPYALDPDLLLRAYAIGVFPMAESADDPHVVWVKPEKRGILPLERFHVPRSLKKVIARDIFELRFDTDFDGVIDGCAAEAPGRETTWINQPIRQAYRALFDRGMVHTVEAWKDNALVGGLYGVSLGAAFFGESMFSREPNASKVCLVALVERLRQQGYQLLDTQFTTDHLKRFGAIDVPRLEYEAMLARAVQSQAVF